MKPEISYSKAYLDFGKGFYVTTFRSQAEKWALTVDMYFRGLWSKKKALEELRYYKMNDQICFANQKVLDNLLIYQESYRVVN
jgi:hypothetical protein